MEIFGKSPIPLPVLILGKLALGVCCAFFLFKTVWLPWYSSDVTRMAGWAFYTIGLILFIFAIAQLGSSIRVGLPDEKTILKTRGLYRFTRNPIYVSIYIVCLGSCLIVIHPINCGAFLLAMLIHHAIIKKEEKFLEKRFGNEWTAYKQQIPRYIGFNKTQ
ncbi:isoprenylcysteine carboxylmethyltransferase family protein [bacterium]|nr:isoprenylcysteine carboxylmethyltransferase family protein [bacterium]